VNRGSLGCLFEIVETLVLTVVIFLVIQTFVAQPYRVEQQSMQHTLEQGQYVLVDKLTPHWDSYSRGDIVVFRPPDADEEDADEVPFIKRVIGTAGDTVEIRAGRVYVNDEVLEEGYLYEDQPTDAGDRDLFEVGEGTLFVMGDHRANSTDSRFFGPIDVTDVVGRAVVRYWPISAFTILQTPRYEGVPLAGAP
jgi:signal peptidase I